MSDDAAATMIRNLEEKTGKKFDEWISVAKKLGESKHGAIVKRLKSEHGLTHGYANLVAHKTLKSDAGSADSEDLVANQYSGKKEGLRPIYDRLVEEINGFGDDVELAPKKAYVSLRRNKQFGLIQPSTAKRVDVGLNLQDETPTVRLEPSGSFNSMVTHRVRIEAADEIDPELIGWLREAYERA